MGIGTALNTGVMGLRAQSKSLQATSNNVANAETTAYKREGAAFESLAVDGRGAGVAATHTKAVSDQGTIENTGNTTDFAVDGEGFMVVGDAPGDNRLNLTRAGSFTPDAEGFLRNAQGQYLKGINLRNQKPGASAPNMDAGNLEAVNVSGINYQPEPTETISFKGNLPRGAKADGTDPKKHLDGSTEVTYVDDVGRNRKLSLQWFKTNDSKYQLTVVDANDNPVAKVEAQFNSGSSQPVGSLKALNGISNTNDPDSSDGSINITAANLPGVKNREITLDLGAPAGPDSNGLTGVTMLDDKDYVVTEVSSDGSSFSTVQTVQLNDDGTLQAVFKNGSTQDLYQIPLASVASPDNLEAIGEQTFRAGPDSGQIQLNASGEGAGKLVGGALEQSTVDLSAELTDLIVTQRNYSANGSAVRTADQMLQRTVQLKR